MAKRAEVELSEISVNATDVPKGDRIEMTEAVSVFDGCSDEVLSAKAIQWKASECAAATETSVQKERQLRSILAGDEIGLDVRHERVVAYGQFEELRLLTNLEHKSRKLVEIVLAGLPSLERKFHTPDFESLNQRAVVRCWVEPMDLQNTEAYIRHRLDVVGAPNPNMFAGDAVERVHQSSIGIARLVNIVCERTLLIGYVDEQQVLKAEHVDQAVADLNLKPLGDRDQQTGALGFEGNLLLRMASQLDSIAKRLDQLEVPQKLATDMREPPEGPRIRQWLKSLRQNPLKKVHQTAEPLDELIDSPVALKPAKTEH